MGDELSFWDRAFLAALAGLCADTNVEQPEMVARGIANKAEALRDERMTKMQYIPPRDPK